MYYLIFLFAVVWCLLIGKAFWVHVLNRDFYYEKGTSQHSQRVVSRGLRGSILDRNGITLARRPKL